MKTLAIVLALAACGVDHEEHPVEWQPVCGQPTNARWNSHCDLPEPAMISYGEMFYHTTPNGSIVLFHPTGDTEHHVGFGWNAWPQLSISEDGDIAMAKANAAGGPTYNQWFKMDRLSDGWAGDVWFDSSVDPAYGPGEYRLWRVFVYD